jgi:iron(III) transport system ATP-binding protein
MNELLLIEGLAFSRGATRVLEDVSLSVGRGERVMVTGPSGCGKTTLLRLIAGLEKPQRGTLRLNGADASALPPHQRGIAMVFQDLGLWPNLSALDNVGLALPRSERSERARRALADCGVEPLAKRRPHQLSGGEQQRVAIARAIAAQPRLLLLDEPFTGLDIAMRHTILDLIDRLARERDASVIVTGHHLPDAKILGARIAVLEGGRILETGSLGDLMAKHVSATIGAWKKEQSQ